MCLLAPPHSCCLFAGIDVQMHSLDIALLLNCIPNPAGFSSPLATASYTQLHDFLTDNPSGLESVGHPEPWSVLTGSDGESRKCPQMQLTPKPLGWDQFLA